MGSNPPSVPVCQRHDPDDINLSTLPVSSRAIIRDQFELALPGAVVSTIPPSVLNGLSRHFHVFSSHQDASQPYPRHLLGDVPFLFRCQTSRLTSFDIRGLIVGGVSSGGTEILHLPTIVLPLITSRTYIDIKS